MLPHPPDMSFHPLLPHIPFNSFHFALFPHIPDKLFQPADPPEGLLPIQPSNKR